MNYHIAQVNIARLLAPIDDPLIADFVAQLDDVNALADESTGFVWRLKGDGNDATSLRPYQDERIIVNMSVWETVDDLYQFTYYSGHVEVFRRRTEWFSKLGAPAMAMWWIPEGHIPTTDEAKAKLALIEQHGPTPAAFTFKQQFPIEAALAHQTVQSSTK